MQGRLLLRGSLTSPPLPHRSQLQEQGQVARAQGLLQQQLPPLTLAAPAAQAPSPSQSLPHLQHQWHWLPEEEELPT